MLYEGCPLYFTLIFKVRGIFGAKFPNTSPFVCIQCHLKTGPLHWRFYREGRNIGLPILSGTFLFGSSGSCEVETTE